MLIRRHLLAAMAFSLGLAACSDVPSAPDLSPSASSAVAQQARGGAPIPDQYIVVFKNDVGDAPGLARQLAASHGGRLHHTYQHAIKGFAATLPEAAANALRHNPNVAYVEQDRIATTQQVGSWGLDRVDQRDRPLNSTYTYAATGSGVRVYVIDTGIATAHAEFGGRASVGYDALGGNGQDCNGHGTHVAGTIGSTTYGVAKAATLIGVRVFPCAGGSAWSTIIAGIDWVRVNHVKPAVANMSLGGAAMQSVDDATTSLINAGVTVVVAAGNDNWDACQYSPARLAAAITVGATNSVDHEAFFSNHGTCLDLYAPGDGITSTWLSGGTNTISGTSMASPHVAGAAALYLQGSPTATPATVRSGIMARATPNRVSGMGAGSPNQLLYTRLDDLTSAPATPYPAAPPIVNIGGPTELYPTGTGTYAWYAYPSGGTGTYSYQWQYRLENASTWTSVGTNSATYTRSIGLTGRPFYLRVTITTGTQTAVDEHYVYVEPVAMCGGNPC
jgi:subtilisin family serine protease